MHFLRISFLCTYLLFTSINTFQADYPQLAQTLVNQGVTQGIQQERQRIGEIIAVEAAAGRERLAYHLAFNTELPAEIALSTLNAALARQDITSPPKPSMHGFEQVMASINNPSIEPACESDLDDPNIMARRIASFSQGAKPSVPGPVRQFLCKMKSMRAIRNTKTC